MANNRMWLMCSGCDSHFLLAKAVAAWSARVDNDEFDKWLTEHEICGFELEGPYPNGTVVHFALKYEETA